MKKSLLTLSSFLFLGVTAFGQAGLPVSQAPANKIAVLEELTGKACQFCPDGHRIANEIAAANPGKVILVNIHAGGYAGGTPNFKTVDGDRIDTFFNPNGYPTGAVQRTASGGKLYLDRGAWAGKVENVINEASPANVALSAEINYDTRLLKVKVEIFYTQGQDAGTKHYLNVGMLQDGLTSTQSGASLNPSAILPNGQYEHTHMFRGFLNTSGTWGDQIDAAETGVIVKEYEYTLPASINANTLDITKLGFYAILHKGKNTLETSQIITGAQVHPTYLNSPDAAMVNLKSVMGEYNVGCADWTSIQPKIKIKNSGRQVNKMKFEYTVNGQAKGDFTITEPLGAYELKTFALSNLEYFTIPNAEVGIKLVAVDDDVIAIGSSSTLTFNVSSAVEVSDPNITLEILTDNYPSETFGRFFKESFSNTVLNFGPFAAGTGQGGAGGADAIAAKSFNITLSGTGCYSLRLNDSYGDGMQYGPTPNPNGGFGYRIKQNGNVIVSNVQSNFDTGFFKDFIGLVKMNVLSTNELENQIGLSIYPNPTRDEATIEMNLTSESKVRYEIVNMLGQIMSSDAINNAVGNVQQTINTSSLSSGQYIVNVFVNESKTQKFLSIVK